MKTKKYQLKNGLSVLLLETHKSPVVSIQMWVKTGSADEGKKQEGISHFIEHLVFKGTRKYNVGEIAQIIEGSGGELNAYTSFDQTVFYVTLTKEFSETGLDVISEMMGFPLFDSKEIDNEREVVIEEIKMGEDSPDRMASQQLFKTIYKKHPYGIPVIGYADNIRKVSTDTLKKYFQTRYVPKNMFLVISGDFESSEMKKLVQKYYGDFKPFHLKKIKRAPEPAQVKSRIKVLTTTEQKSILTLAWKGPSVNHKDVPALDVLSLILGQGDSARLPVKLRMEKPIVNGIGASAFTPQDPGFFAITAHLEAPQIQECLSLVAIELEKIMNEPPTAEEMQKAVTNLASEQIYSVETVDGVARKAGSLEFYTGDYNYFPKYLKQIYALKAEDIQKAAIKYIKNETLNAILQTNMPAEHAEKELNDFAKQIKKIAASAKVKKSKTTKPSKFKKLALATTAKSEKVETDFWTHSSGMKIIYRKQTETPTVSFRMGFLGGSRLDPIGHEGQTELLTRTWTAGSKNYSEVELNNSIDGMASSISAFGGRNTIGLTADFLSTFSDEMLKMTQDLLLHPTFSGEMLEREKSILLRQIKSKMENPSAICMNKFMEELFKDHPYGRDSYGTAESLNKIHHKDLIDYYKKVSSAANMTLAVVGDISRASVERFAHDAVEKLSTQKFKEPKFDLKSIDREVTKTQEMKKEQTHIMLGYRGLSIYSPDRFTLQVAQSILAGQGGRLFVELRDKSSLAYSVAPMRMEGLDSGYFGAYIGCSPEKSEKAIRMIHEEFEKLATDLVSEEELMRAQKYLIGRHNIDLQRKSSICQSLLLDTIYGIDHRETFEIAEKYFAVNREHVRDLAKQIFSQKCVTVLVGPQSVSNIKDKGL